MMLLILSITSFYCKAQEETGAPGNGITATKMVNPDIDDPDKPWCYLQNSTTVIGFPYMPDAVQVTYDGAIYTREAELCFFYGDSLKPVMQRQKWWYKGWIPIIEYNWESDKIRYAVEMFGFPLAGESAKNILLFARIKMTNESQTSERAKFTVATRSTGEKNRFGSSIFKEYISPFKASDLNVKKNTAVCLVNYSPLLKPGKSVQYTFKMPRVPVDTSNKTLIHKIQHAKYKKYRKRTINYWEHLILKGHPTFDIPEKRVNEALKASLVQMTLATRERNGKRFMTDGLPYPNLFLTSFVQHEKAFDCFGLKAFTDQNLPGVYAKQDSNGLFYDGALLHGKKLGVAQGQTIQMLCEHYLLTRDKLFIDTVYPKIKAAVAWIKNAVMHDKYHLMPPAWPYDNEMIPGHYTSNNLWAILGVRSAIRVARDMGKQEDAEKWEQFQDFYKTSLLKAITTTFKEKGYVTPGLYKYKIGETARKGFADWQTNQEWENMLLVSPSELLSPGSAIVDSTPYFVHLAGFKSDASKTERKGRLLFFSPDVRKINLQWEKDKNADKGTFADILKRYRSESTLRIVNNKEVISPHSAYLLPEEKKYPPAPLSFDLVKKAFKHEYTLRFNKFKAAGGKIDTVAAPPLIPK